MYDEMKRQRSGLTMLMLAALVLPLLAVSTAQADHAKRRGHNPCGHMQCGVRCPAVDACDLRLSVDLSCLNHNQRRAYIAGFKKGDRRGRKIGWEDGLRDREFNPCVRRSFRNRGPMYERGYRDAFRPAYRYGYRKAQRRYGRRVCWG